MKKFTATLNDMSFINIPADRMELVDNMLRVYDGRELVAITDISAIITAHVGERNEKP